MQKRYIDIEESAEEVTDEAVDEIDEEIDDEEEETDEIEDDEEKDDVDEEGEIKSAVADSMNQFLSRAGKIPLLSVDEERELAIRIASGDENAKTQLVDANLRLVVSIAKRYNAWGIPFPDLIQEGNIGLMRAIEAFDYRKGCKFSTFATWWIRQKITRAVASQSRLRRLPYYMIDLVNRAYKVIGSFFDQNHREPNAEELQEAMNISLPKKRHISLKKAGDILDILTKGKDIQLSQLVGDTDVELADVIEDDQAIDPENIAFSKLQSQELYRMLTNLSPREEKVICRRFGLDGNGGAKLEEIGHELHVTRERIRQIEAKALRKLRSPHRHRKLKEIVEPSGWRSTISTLDY